MHIKKHNKVQILFFKEPEVKKALSKKRIMLKQIMLKQIIEVDLRTQTSPKKRLMFNKKT